MSPIFAIKYIDAVYYNEDSEILNFKGFVEHVAIGKITDIDSEIIVTFVEKNNKPYSGLLLPRNSLILNTDQKNFSTSNKVENIKEGTTIGTYWIDITYFTNSLVPKKCTRMYTEGLYRQSKSGLIIENPVTIKVREEGVFAHPKKQDDIKFCVLPWNLISNIEKYDG